MRFFFCLFSVAFYASAVLPSTPVCAEAQESGSGLIAVAQLPDAPLPHAEIAAAEPPALPPTQRQNSAAQDSAAQDSSSTQTDAQRPPAQKSRHERAEEQLKEQEKQRAAGFFPSFNVSYRSDAVSLSAGQKMRLAFRTAIDPVTFAEAFIVAGYHEGLDDDKGFGGGPLGYAKRSGAAYLDAFDGTMIGNGILPSILHQDPRYFRLGHGSAAHRLLYALASNVICKHDNTGKWEPNYSNIGGNIAAGAISNLYYPSDDSGVGQTLSNGLIVTAEGGVGSIFQEFWPDFSRRFLHKDPAHGLDAQARAEDAARKPDATIQK